MMDKIYLYGLIFVLLIIIGLREVLRGNKWRGVDDEQLTSYKSKQGAGVYKKRLLLTKPEYGFWGVLKKKCDEQGLLICPKVRIEDFVTVICDDAKLRQRYRGYVKSRHIDFLLCDSKLSILAGVELDDKSHDKGNVKKVDTLKDDVFGAIGVPLYRIKAHGGYESQIDDIFVSLGLKEKREPFVLQDEWRLPLGKKNGEKGV